MIALYQSGSASISTLQMMHYDPECPHRAVIGPRGASIYVFIVIIAAGFNVWHGQGRVGLQASKAMIERY